MCSCTVFFHITKLVQTSNNSVQEQKTVESEADSMQMMMIVIRSQMTTRFRCQLQCPKYLCPMFRLRSVSILS